ncbi:helix-turn-helix domain-containing protein [Micromonospora globispora]|uniref:helix-turn-helix domain-containing protein n=1 Tax=Micromonospora globispora TaxID=1450148 RepID=UPI00163A167E|nr:helix-turn-helix transcriptional regulator [Micromonospora globispora]
MRGIGQSLTIGERIAWYRRRRGMSQEVLAGLVGRTVDWLSKVENGRIDLDRLSVIRAVADQLDVALGDLLGEPSVLDWSREGGTRTVPALRETLLNYRQLSPFLATEANEEAPDLAQLRGHVGQVWDAYQESRYGFVASRLPMLVKSAQAATALHDGGAQVDAFRLLALSYQAAAVLLPKLGESDLAWIAAERGFNAAQRSGDTVLIGSLFRSLTHTLLCTGRYKEAKQLTQDAAAFLQSGLGNASPAYLSIYGTLFLAGSIAAARDDDRATANAFLAEAETAALRLGRDENHLWTAFGPTNVAIHRATAALDLGDVQVAIDLGARVDASAMPKERQVRHAIETARALSAWNRTDEAMTALLDAEQIAPEQVRHHAISRQLVQAWMRRGRRKPSATLASLARRVHVAD